MRAEQVEWQFDCLQSNVAAQVIDVIQAQIGELS
jgi:3-dehydroquinate dehydratase